MAYTVTSLYPNLCWVNVNWTFRNKLQWNLNQNTKLFIHENASENIVCEMAAILSKGRWVKTMTEYQKGYSVLLAMATRWLACHLFSMLSSKSMLNRTQENRIQIEILKKSFKKRLVDVIPMVKSKKDITPLLTHWSYAFLALTHRYVHSHSQHVRGKESVRQLCQEPEVYPDGLMQNRSNSSALALELLLFCIKPSNW